MATVVGNVFVNGRDTGLPSMTNKLGRNVLRAGIHARTIGVRESAAAINAELLRLTGYTVAGILEALVFLRQDMDVTPPTIPVDTGNLRASWHIGKTYMNQGGPVVEAGFDPLHKDTDGYRDQDHSYAVFVHEMVDEAYSQPINWSVPGSGPKFLEKALARNKEQIVRIIGSQIGVSLRKQRRRGTRK